MVPFWSQLPYAAPAILWPRTPIPTHQIHHHVAIDGRILLEGLPVRRGQHVRITIEIEEDALAPAPPVPEADLKADQERRGNSVTSTNDLDPSEPACDPMEWNAMRGILVNEEWDRENLPPLAEPDASEELT